MSNGTSKIRIYCPHCKCHVGDFEFISACEREQRQGNNILDRSLDDMEWSSRIANCFFAEGIKTLRDLVRREPFHLLRLPNFGRQSLREVEGELSALNLHLGMEV